MRLTLRTLTLSVFLVASLGRIMVAQPPGKNGAPLLVIDASGFLDEIQKGHVVTDAARLRVPWVFNNTALEMRTNANYVIRTQVPTPGRYYLYARTQGDARSAFRVAIGDKVIARNIGDAPMRFERVGEFDLIAGPVAVRLMRIEGRPVLDVLVLSTRADVREEELLSMQLHPDVRLLREYDIPRSNAVKFGDVDGDRQTDLLVLEPGYSARMFDSDGQPLWSWIAPTEGERLRAEFEAPGAVWDLDQDGKAEVIHWREIDGMEWLVAADGATGAIRYRAPWPTRAKPHVYNNFRIAIGRLRQGYPAHVILLSDSGDSIVVAAYDAKLEMLWNHVEVKKKDHLGHYVYPIDLDRDGVDEVVVGSLVLDATGKERWNRFDLFYDNHDHADSYRFADLNGDGRLDVVSAQSEAGVFAFDAANGKVLWQNMAEHSQQIAIGTFRSGVPGPHVAVGARTYGNTQAGEPGLSAQVWWFTRTGELISKWPGMPLNGNPVFVQGDWKGDGSEHLFWYKFRMGLDGRGQLYFPDGVFHMFDLLGDGAEEVITLSPGKLRVYGYRGADPNGTRVVRSPEYLRSTVVNHTHY
jgi:hypothetical protein